MHTEDERARLARELAPKVLEVTDGALVIKALAYLIYVQHGSDNAEEYLKEVNDYICKFLLFTYNTFHTMKG